MRSMKLVLFSTLLFGSIIAFSTRSNAGFPYPPLCTCTVTITQFPTRAQCISSWEPDVVRLTPAGSNATPQFDRVSITVRARNSLNNPVVSALVAFHEANPSDANRVNIANGGSTTAFTDATGLATVSLTAASGSGVVWLCADGIQLCALDVRSPDVTKSSAPTLCGLGTSASSVSGGDITNPACGFLAGFGPVTAGVNDGFDLNCDHNVNGVDINGLLGNGGVLQYFGDTGTLGVKNTCALP
ncbi:MAG: hypothetical protein ACKVU1_10615 [bacterium]